MLLHNTIKIYTFNLFCRSVSLAYLIKYNVYVGQFSISDIIYVNRNYKKIYSRVEYLSD